jgi:hypothetical protein
MLGSGIFNRFETPTPPTLTPSRVRLAYGCAVAADVLQMMFGPLGWVLADQIIDVVAAFVSWRLLGFHPLLLPTFVVEFLPIVDMLPTWTGCVALVVARRKKQQAVSGHDRHDGKVIDVEAKRVD